MGDDANPCSRTAPCKTFAGAISKTAVGGEINAIDPGGYGAVTITKSITIDGGGTMASILASLTTGVIVNAPAGSIVILRNLSINGAGNGIDGIRFLAGAALHVENVTVDRFTGRGLLFTPATAAELFVRNGTFGNSAQGIDVLPTGGAGAIAKATIVDSRLLNNTGAGLKGQANSIVSASNSVASGNNNGFIATGANSFMELQGCGASNNVNNGVSAGFGAPTSTVAITDCLITGNGIGVNADAAGVVRSWGDNKIIHNGLNGAPTLPLLTLQ